MKILLKKAWQPGNKLFPPGAVVAVSEPVGNALVKSGAGIQQPDDTRARMVAYEEPVCAPTEKAKTAFKAELKKAREPLADEPTDTKPETPNTSLFKKS